MSRTWNLGCSTCAQRRGEWRGQEPGIWGVPLCSLWSMTAGNKMGLELICAQAQMLPVFKHNPLGPSSLLWGLYHYSDHSSPTSIFVPKLGKLYLY